jgi:hypothetical protein
MSMARDAIVCFVAIKKANEIGWSPPVLINYVSSSVSATIMPAGADKAVPFAPSERPPNDVPDSHATIGEQCPGGAKARIPGVSWKVAEMTFPATRAADLLRGDGRVLEPELAAFSQGVEGCPRRFQFASSMQP